MCALVLLGSALVRLVCIVVVLCLALCKNMRRSRVGPDRTENATSRGFGPSSLPDCPHLSSLSNGYVLTQKCERIQAWRGAAAASFSFQQHTAVSRWCQKVADRAYQLPLCTYAFSREKESLQLPFGPWRPAICMSTAAWVVPGYWPPRTLECLVCTRAIHKQIPLSPD